MDIEYFQFTSKRSTADLFTVLGAGEDFSQLVGTFISDSWHLIIFLILFIVISNWLYNKSKSIETITFKTVTKKFWAREIISFLVVAIILFLIGRGSLGVKPVGPLSATQFTKIENTALVLNTPFTMIKSISNSSLKEEVFFTEKELNQIYEPVHNYNPGGTLNDSTNVVIIMLESFGNEWVGNAEHDSYTPFLDSLISESLYFPKGIANGKKSIEAVPSIVSGIPSLTDNPYITSNYGTNTIQSLPSILKKYGYNSTFYHGATNGSMMFDQFTELAGYDSYQGRNEYNNEKHADATWGILDEYFNPWSAAEMSKLQQPFFSTLFTLSSHHPYFVPEQYRETLPTGPTPMAQSIAYGDMSLKLFFEEAKKHPYYENTVFVILADHTPAGKGARHMNRIGMYRIPILFYTPNGKIKPNKSDLEFGQIDILPTLLDLLNIKESAYGFGESYFKPNKTGTFTYIQGTYQYYANGYMLTFANGKGKNLYNYELDFLMESDSISYLPKVKNKLENKLKAIIQHYNHDLIYNQMTIK